MTNPTLEQFELNFEDAWKSLQFSAVNGGPQSVAEDILRNHKAASDAYFHEKFSSWYGRATA